MKRLIPILFIVLLTSCTFSSKDDKPRAEKAIYPDIILEDAEYLLGQKGEEPIVIYGEKMVLYSKDNKAELEMFSFSQKDKAGNVILEGRADEGLIFTESKKMELKGNVTLIQVSEGMEIKSDSVFFDSDEEVVSAPGRVMVKSKDGSFSGRGFNGDLKNSIYSFEMLEEGNIEL